ncbi:MAG: diguanylate cyclase [Armatimonadetes bacterium]|nr:diguanylate cyclase [Armatimonadota bacterium]
MLPAATERIRTHRRQLAARWARQMAAQPDGSLWWQDAERLDRLAQSGLEALLESLTTGKPEPFVEFAARLSQEAFAFHVPLQEVIRALLQIKPVVIEFLNEPAPWRLLDVVSLQLLDRLASAAVLEGIRLHEWQRGRRTVVVQTQLEELRDRLRRQVVVDPTTGLFNANYFAIAVRREVRRSRRFGRPFAVALISLDQDDEIRTAWGEDGLRAVTLHLADLLTNLTRQVDVRATLAAGRFGLIMPETTEEGAFVAAERIRRAVEQNALALADRPFPLTQTVSIGLACFPQDAEDDRALLARLEEALARARGGRNTTVAAVSAENP